jgi:prepilin-type N-terminal cleavage/methylation domain-containing protein
MVARVRVSDERGFTLTELLVAMSVGIVVLLAAFTVLDRSFSASSQIADRSDALQRGRLAMDLVTRQLRSQVCLGTSSDPIVAASNDSVTFYADLSDGTQQVQRRTLTYSPSADTLTQSVIHGAGTYPNLSFNSPPATETLLTNMEPIMDGSTARPVFRYYGYKAGGALGDLEPLSAPLSPANLSRVAVIKVGFRSFAARRLNDDSNSVVIEDDVYVRLADPNNLAEGPVCI